MADQQHPIAPPPELIRQWTEEHQAIVDGSVYVDEYIATQAARWADYRDLITRMAKELDNYRQLLLDDRTVTHRLSDEARAALAEADEPAVPEGREPAAVTGQPSDEERLDLHEWMLDEWAANHDAVMARWGRPAPAPPATPISDDANV